MKISVHLSDKSVPSVDVLAVGIYEGGVESASGLEKAVKEAAKKAISQKRFTGKDARWCRSVEPDCLFEIIEEGVKLNEPFFIAYKAGMERVGKALNLALEIQPPSA